MLESVEKTIGRGRSAARPNRNSKGVVSTADKTLPYLHKSRGTSVFNLTGGKGWGVHHKTLLLKHGYNKRPLSAARIRQEKGRQVLQLSNVTYLDEYRLLAPSKSQVD